MIKELQKESVLIWSLDVDHAQCSSVCRDISRFESSLDGNESGCMTFLTWGLMIVLNEALEGDLEITMLMETPWGSSLVTEARKKNCNQIQVIAGHRIPAETHLEVVE